MPVLNPQADAQRAMQVMQDGGIATLPNGVGHSLIAAITPALQKIVKTKQQASH